MIFERVKSEGIAHISYFVGSNSEAVVIDPRRDCQVYIGLARREEMKIKYIFETHRNEDYTIGSLELGHFTEGKSITAQVWILNTEKDSKMDRNFTSGH